MTIEELCADWHKAKEAERRATEHRREIEDEIARVLAIPADLDGTRRADVEGWDVKVVGRIDRKVDTDALQELAAAAGLTDHLSALFRWKAEINARAWDHAADSITKPLMGAITTKPGRPSFQISKKEH